MSLNKVLNRPMFRREALRKGVLKPIRAKVGIYAGPGYKQGPEFVPQSQYSKFPLQFQGPKGKSFAYDPKSGSYITGYGKGKIKSGTAKFAKGLTGLGALYAGAEMAGIPDPLLQTAAFSELASLPLGLAKGKTAQTVGRILGSGSRLATSNPLGAIGIGGALALTGGAKAYYDESKMVKDYARANNIDYKKALDIFNRDLSFGGGRPMTASDVGKMVIGASSARDLVKGGLDKTPEGPPGSKSYEQRVAGEMRKYMEESKTYGRYFQDVDQLVKKVKDKQRAYSMAEETASMSPDDAMQFDQVGRQRDFEEKIATVELRNALMAQKNLDINKASNLALAITGGEIEANDVDAIVKSDELYAQVPNNANDPNHPKFIKEEKTVKEIDKKNKKVEQEVTTGENEQRDTVGENDQQTGDPEVDNSKKLASTVDIAQFLRADPRNTQMDPNRVMLMKLAAGLLSGKSMQGGLAGAAEIFGAALGPAIDAKVLVKMKNDEAYRDWASQVLTYNASLYKARNDAVKMKLTPGSFAMPDGTFAEARRDKETGDVYISQNGQLIPVNEQQGQFFEQKSDALLFDNVKLIADGYLSDKLLSDSIQLMESNKGKTAIGASGIFVNLIDLAKNIPGELRDGFFGANPTFEISQGDLSDKEYKKLQKRTNSAVEDLEEGIEEFLKNNPEASSVLAKLRVNARMLTYSLANSLKDKDRLTNRDLELIEQLTKTMTAGMTDEKIISQYKELLKAVREKNKIRIGKLGISGYTQQDTTTILNSMGLGSYAPKFTTEKEFDIDSATAAFNELMGIK
jgi:hypothetical protein